MYKVALYFSLHGHLYKVFTSYRRKGIDVQKRHAHRVKQKVLLVRTHTMKFQQSTFIYTILYPITRFLSQTPYQRLRFEKFTNPLRNEAFTTCLHSNIVTLSKFRFEAKFHKYNMRYRPKRQKELLWCCMLNIEMANLPVFSQNRSYFGHLNKNVANPNFAFVIITMLLNCSILIGRIKSHCNMRKTIENAQLIIFSAKSDRKKLRRFLAMLWVDLPTLRMLL